MRKLLLLSLLAPLLASAQPTRPIWPPFTGTLPTSVLPGLLPGLSGGDGQGVLTNLAAPFRYSVFNTSQVSTLSTNFIIPSWARMVEIEGIGPGGAGGSGMRGPAGSIRSGGGGGAGGGYGRRLVNVLALYTNILRVVIGPIVLGGDGPTTDSTYGTNGGAATYIAVYAGAVGVASNCILRLNSGTSGSGGDSDGVVASSATTAADHEGTPGGASSTTGGAGSLSTSIASRAARGGGGGGGISTADIPAIGGGGLFNYGTFIASLSGGSINGVTVPTWLSSYPALLAGQYGACGGPGASGSGGSTNGPSANGGDGEGFGSGGGGSGATLNGSTPGRGGHGGPGGVWITIYHAFPAIAASDWVYAVAQWTGTLIKHLAYSSERITK